MGDSVREEQRESHGWLRHGNPPGDPSKAPRCEARTRRVLTAGVNSTIVAGENLTVGSTVWLPAEGLAPGR
jgi:hypothetical protein